MEVNGQHHAQVTLPLGMRYVPITQFLVFCFRHLHVSQCAFKNINYAY